MKNRKTAIMLSVIFLSLLFFSCAANNEMYISKPAGFWAGLWHGLIIIVTFVISLFTDSVTIYEINNTGGWYNFGFVLGILIALSHGGIWTPFRECSHKKSEKEKEWDDIGDKVEEKVRAGIKKWLDESDKKETDWGEIARKVEEKIKRELRNWAEE